MFDRIATVDKKKFQQDYCSNCTGGIIIQKEFDFSKALDYLESLGIEDTNSPTCRAFAYRAKFEAMKNGIDTDFLYKETDSYECLFSGICAKINDKVITL